jgi:hypothetical protein
MARAAAVGCGVAGGVEVLAVDMQRIYFSAPHCPNYFGVACPPHCHGAIDCAALTDSQLIIIRSRKMNTTDKAIAKLEAKVQVLQLAIAELRNVADQEPDEAAPKVRKTRKKKGLPSAEPPASEANHRERL